MSQKCRACELPIKEFDFNRLGPAKRELGRGTYGVVTLHDDKITGAEVVVKSNLVQEDGKALSADFVIETSSLASLQGHPNIVKFLGCGVHTVKFKPPKSLTISANSTIVLETATDSLSGWLSKTVPTSEQKESIMYQIIRGVDWMHRNGIWHRDLKPQNVLAFNDGRFAITDFGLARGGPFQFTQLSKLVGTLWWRAPEIMIQSAHSSPLNMQVNYDASSDVWALGIIFYELLHVKQMSSYLRGNDDNEQLWKLVRAFGSQMTDEYIISLIGLTFKEFLRRQAEKQKTDDWKNAWMGFHDLAPHIMTGLFKGNKTEMELGVALSADELSLLQGLLHVDPKQRLTTEQALKHPYFARIAPIVDVNFPAPTSLPPLSMPLTCSEWGNEVTPRMWTILIDWLYEVTHEFKLTYASLLLGIHVLRCYLSDVRNHKRSQLQAQGMCAFWLADAYTNDVDISPSVGDWVYISDNTVTNEELVEIQKEMFLAVGAKLHLPSSWAKVMELIESSWSTEEINKAASRGTDHDIGHVLAIIEASPESFDMTTDEIAQMAFLIISNKEVNDVHLLKIQKWLETQQAPMFNESKPAVQKIMHAQYEIRSDDDDDDDLLDEDFPYQNSVQYKDLLSSVQLRQ
jgi:serine/threonine protein kinase